MANRDENAKNAIEKFFGEVNKTSALKQIVIGASSGWVTGYLAMRVGKTAAMALGGGIILLEIAKEKGYVKINWDKVNKNLDQVADKVEEKITGQGPTWMNKVERYVDRKLDNAENKLNKSQGKVKSWFSNLTGDTRCQLKEVHVFLISFVAGVALGIGTA